VVRLLDPDTKRDYENVWGMFQETSTAGQCIECIKDIQAAMLEFPGSGSNANCALRTKRRMVSLARDSETIANVYQIAFRRKRATTLLRSVPFQSEF
jgi:hypothetical protein